MALAAAIEPVGRPWAGSVTPSDAIDVAMAVGALESEGLPVTMGVVEAGRRVVAIATEPTVDQAQSIGSPAFDR